MLTTTTTITFKWIIEGRRQDCGFMLQKLVEEEIRSQRSLEYPEIFCVSYTPYFHFARAPVDPVYIINVRVRTPPQATTSGMISLGGGPAKLTQLEPDIWPTPTARLLCGRKYQIASVSQTYAL